MSLPRPLSLFRFSLRSLLLATAFISIGCIALKYAGPVWWTILSGISLILLMAGVVIALVGRDEPRAFASGFIACMAVYAALLHVGGAKEFDPYNGYLPTSKILLPAHRVMSKVTYIDMRSGNVLLNYDPSVGGGGMPGGPGGMQSVSAWESPPREQFMAIGQLLWADLLAVCGGLFACFVYCRSRRFDQTRSSEERGMAG